MVDKAAQERAEQEAGRLAAMQHDERVSVLASEGREKALSILDSLPDKKLAAHVGSALKERAKVEKQARQKY